MVRSLLLILVLFLAGDSQAQDNVIYGKVTFPEVKRKIKVSRGTQYRNRLNQVKLEDNKEPEVSANEQVVISAVPLDFTPELVPQRATITQKDKAFIPNVLPIIKGSTVEFLNKDDFYHNVFSLTPRARFNIGRRKPGRAVSQTIQKSGEIKIFCDIHPQMNAIILSLETPYFSKVDERGNYALKDLPDGNYEINFYHPSFSFPPAKIRVEGGIRKAFNFDDLVWHENEDHETLVVSAHSCCNKDKDRHCEN
jgi:plastocyanin